MLYGIKVQNQITPQLIDEKPTFSWKMKSKEKEVLQNSYEVNVKVAGSPEILWTSGVVESEKSIGILYEGPELIAFTDYEVEIRVVDNKGKTHAEITTFTTGVRKQENWKGTWITGELCKKQEGVPVFYKEFSLEKPVKKAVFYGTALGIYEVQIDGEQVSDTFFAPGWTTYGKRVQYQCYDVTSFLKIGAHSLKMFVANGWYKGYLNCDGSHSIYGEQVAALGMLRIIYEDGEICTIGTDGSWKIKESLVTSAEIYHGETRDYTKVEGQVEAAEEAPELGNGITIEAQSSEPIRITERFKPKELLQTPNGQWVIDFGQNMAGVVEVQLPLISGKIGTLVIKHGETLDKEGNFYTENLRSAKSKDTYIYGKEMENRVVMPHFTYHGFRYIALEGAEISLENKEAWLQRFTACAMHSDMEAIGHFQCDAENVNRLQQNICWGERSNFFDVPTDCPQRDERLGWTGDATIFCGTASYNYDTKAFFRKWLKDVALETDDAHGVPHIVPAIEGKQTGTAVWSDAATFIPWQIYESYGDLAVLEEEYPLMKQWVDYVYRQSGEDILWLHGFQRGDWLALDAPMSQPTLMSGGTDKNLVANVYYAVSTRMVRDAAEALGKKEDFAEYSKRYENLCVALEKEYMTETGRLVSETQTACALLLHYDLIPEDKKTRALEIFRKSLDATKNHLTTGFIGTAALLPALSEHGLHDRAEDVFFQEDYPGWFFAIHMGATTIWERWDSVRADGSFDTSGMNSLNHYSYGAVGDWLYRQVGGISPLLPGYKKIKIAPRLTKGMTEVEATLESPYGLVGCKWTCRQGKIRVEVEIPANTMAEVYLPEKEEVQFLGSGIYAYEYETTTNLLKTVYNRQTTFAEVLDNEATKEVLFSCMPELRDHPMIGFMRGKTFGEMEQYNPAIAQQMDALLEKLNRA